ncbi:MAG: hypothetical protein QW321_00270, partial [Candidatus Aenigmatarchaeota archaeon]
MAKFTILKTTESDFEKFVPAAQKHLERLQELHQELFGIAGERFVKKWVDAFSETGSPIFVNLDHNMARKITKDTKPEEIKYIAQKVFKETQGIIESTAGHVSGYKMNLQSELTCLTAGNTEFVEDWKKLYADICEEKYKVRVEPVFWLDAKIDEVDHSSYEQAKIHFSLGFDAIHTMPQIGPSTVGSVQFAAEEMGKRGVVHVINMTHRGYEYVKNSIFNPDAINVMRKNAVNGLDFQIEVEPKPVIKTRATGVIEPANRPFEIYQGVEEVYNNKIMIISIGIGPQGALPGCALYAGATCEGIGRWMYDPLLKGEENAFEKIERRARAATRCAL